MKKTSIVPAKGDVLVALAAVIICIGAGLLVVADWWLTHGHHLEGLMSKLKGEIWCIVALASTYLFVKKIATGYDGTAKQITLFLLCGMAMAVSVEALTSITSSPSAPQAPAHPVDLSRIQAGVDSLLRSGDAAGVGSGLARLGVSPDARILQQDRGQYLLIGHLESILTDLIQFHKGSVGLRPVWQQEAGKKQLSFILIQI